MEARLRYRVIQPIKIDRVSTFVAPIIQGIKANPRPRLFKRTIRLALICDDDSSRLTARMR